MNPSFGEWYRKANIQPRHEDLLARSQAIEVFTKNVDKNTIAELIRCFVGIPARDVTVIARFVEQLLATDTAFPTQNNALELQVLCGAALASVLEHSSHVADTAALLLISAAAPSFRKAPVVPDIVRNAQTYLMARSAAVRKLDARPNVVGAEHDQLIEAVKAACATNQAVQLQQPLDTMLKGLNDTLNKVASLAEQATRVLERSDNLLLEESNIVWWVFGGHSRDTGKRFSELPPGFAAVLAGKELADITRFIPGPIAAPAYLDKQLDHLSGKKLKLSDVAVEISTDWLGTLCTGSGVRLRFAIFR
ncbi:MAG: hypothetical protein CXZ00_16510 [Acidobacteria bacterium]|nr:MAG: hypothetical protein CXZ00_16510 [Acidobacteriota bacterium]